MLYLALRGGGYDVIVRDEVAILAWWVVLLGAIVGALPLARLGGVARWGFALMAVLAAWTALSMLWSESVENSFEEFARIGTYLGVFALSLGLQGREGMRRTVGAIAAAIAVVTLLAVLSRLHPSWFPANELAQSAPEPLAMLSYPLNYWNGVAAFVAMGLPLIVAIAATSRHLLTRTLATAVLPVMALTIFYTHSRSGAVVAVIGLLAFIALSRHRLRALPVIGLGSLGSALLIGAASQREALRDGLTDAVALHQGDEMIAAVLVTFTGIALLSVAIALAARYRIGPRPRFSARLPHLNQWQKLGAAAAVLAVIAVGAVGTGATAELSGRWQEFKSSGGAGNSTTRFEVASGSGRYQYWSSAVDAFESEPLVGIGAGSYEYWWLREGTIAGTIRDAHSLYFETLGELGFVGLALVLGLIGLILVHGVRIARSSRAPDRELLAGAVAASIVFAIVAGIDWLWEIAVIPVAFLMIAAAILARRSDESSDDTAAALGLPLKAPIAGALVALPVLVVLTVSLLGAQSLRNSEAAAGSGDLEGALADARSAQEVQPYAASPYMQEALILLEQGDPDAAINPALIATEKEPTNWRTWYTVWQIKRDGAEIESQVPSMRDAYERAFALNPRSGSFTSPAPPETDAGP